METRGKRVVLKGQGAIDLWLKGRDAWSEWVEENPFADVDFSGVDFSKHRNHPTIDEDNWPFADFIFPKGYVYFDETSFGEGNAYFYDSSFNDGDVTFKNASFGEGNVRFDNVSFGEGRTSFKNVRFGDGDVNFTMASFGDGMIFFTEASFGEGVVSFLSVEFGAFVYFSNLRNVGAVKFFSFAYAAFQSSMVISSDEPFGCVVDLTGTKMNNQISLERLQCSLKKTKNYLRSEWLGKAKACYIEDIVRFRRLKEIAGNNKDHEQALNFNVMEMQAKRWHKTTIAGLFFEFLFQKSSDYGRSEFRPFMWMVAVWSLWSWFYFLLSDAMENSLFNKISTAATFSVGQMISFVPISRAARSDGAELLFPGDQLPNAVIWLASFQSVISIILIFLIGLSLRNRFKV